MNGEYEQAMLHTNDNQVHHTGGGRIVVQGFVLSEYVLYVCRRECKLREKIIRLIST